MIQATYLDEISYIKSATDLKSELAAIEAVRAALLVQMLTIASGKPISEYMLNDGQTLIKRTYTNPTQIMAVRGILETEANDIRKLLRGGRTTRMVPGDSFVGGCWQY